MNKGFKVDESGFTLLELLISITLTAVIVVILSMALRSGLLAWERGRNTNDKIIRKSAVESLLGRQLRAVIKRDSDLKSFSDFHGGERYLSFVTTYTPMGVQAGGLFKVVYRIEEDGTFIYAQRLVTRPEDIKKELEDNIGPGDRERLLKEGWDVSIIQEMPPLIFSFKEGDEIDSPGEWPREWDQKSKLPVAVAIGWRNKDTDKGYTISWRPLYLEPLI